MQQNDTVTQSADWPNGRDAVSGQQDGFWARRPVVLAALGAIILFSILGNLYWIDQNVMLVGRDSTGHLERTVEAYRSLTSARPSGLFHALIVDDYRPPLLYLVAQPFYFLFGVDFDSAQLANILLFGVVIALTYLSARRMLPSGAALFAALLVSLLPLPVAMARLFYMEHLLTAVLLTNLLALLAADGWQRRGWTILWGATLGVGMLVKWTFPIYLMLPTAYLMWQHGLLDWRRYRPRSFRVDWRRMGLAALGALLFLALWYWPNRNAIAELPPGLLVPAGWFILGFAALYLLLGPADTMHRFWGAVFLGLWVASLWYLPRSEFVVRLTDVAFGTDRGNQESLNVLRGSNYTRYFRYWITYHMGLLATLLIFPVALYGWFKRWRHWRLWRSDYGIVLLTLISPMLVLFWLAQANPRNLVPILPLIALLLADSLLAYPHRWAVAAGTLWTLVLGVQWAIFTFDGLAPLHTRTEPLWVIEDYSTWPATRTTDPGNWIQPDILAAIGDPEGEPATFGMLVDTWTLHRGSLRYLIAADQRNIQLMPLTEWEGRGWSDMLANQWILVKDGDNSEIDEPGYTVAQRILNGDPLFHGLYAEEKRYRLPDGDTVYLYHRAAGPRDPYEFPVVLIETAGIAEAVNLWSGPDTTVFFSNPDVATWVGIHDIRAGNILVGAEDQPLDALLGDLQGTIVAVTRYDTPAVQEWLRSNSDYVTETGENEFHATVFGRTQRPLVEQQPLSAWDEVQITTVRMPASVAPGEVLPIELDMQGPTDGSRKISVRLLSPDGDALAQRDVVVAETARLALLVPPDAASGDYRVHGVVYDGGTGVPLPSRDGDDLAPLAPVTVE